MAILVGMTSPTLPPRFVRKPGAAGRAFARNERAAAMVEMALVLPLFVTLVMGILVYGQYFMLAHSVQQAANDGARAAIAGLDVADRSAIALRAVDRSMQAIGSFTPESRTVAVSETAEAITVRVTFTVPEKSFVRSTFVPSPGNVISAAATFELPVD